VACFFADDLARGDGAALSLEAEEIDSALLSGLELGSAGVGNSFRAIGLRVDIVLCVGGGGRVEAFRARVVVVEFWCCGAKFASALELGWCVCFHLHFRKAGTSHVRTNMTLGLREATHRPYRQSFLSSHRSRDEMYGGMYH
jgi:hypothetical protein